MGRDTFQFRHFTLNQENCGMRISTDGVLLGAWCMPPVHNNATAIDVGSGTGVISFFLAQRFPHLQIHGVEIDSPSFQRSCSNLNNYTLPNQIKFFNYNFLTDYQHYYLANTVDFIVSNPPFFTEGIPIHYEARAKARYAITLSPNELFGVSAKLLSSQGKLAIITPFTQFANLKIEALAVGLMLLRATEVITTEGKPPKRILTEWCHYNSNVNSLYDSITIRDKRLRYTHKYISLLSPFYRADFFTNY